MPMMARIYSSPSHAEHVMFCPSGIREMALDQVREKISVTFDPPKPLELLIATRGA